MLYKKIKILVLTLFVISLTGCGYSSLYHKEQTKGYGMTYSLNVVDQLKQIKVLHIGERVGQILRNRLLDNLSPLGETTEPKYYLSVSVPAPSIRDQVLEQDTTATRKTARYNASYNLKQGDNIIVNGKSRIEVSYNVLKNPYSTLISQKDAERRAAKILADDITLRLAAYFKSL